MLLIILKVELKNKLQTFLYFTGNTDAVKNSIILSNLPNIFIFPQLSPYFYAHNIIHKPNFTFHHIMLIFGTTIYSVLSSPLPNNSFHHREFSYIV